MKLFTRRSNAETDALFLEIFHAHQQQVFHYIYRMLGERESAEDLVQEVFLKIYSHLPRYQEKQKRSSWVFTITHTTLMDYFRKTRTHQKLFTESEDLPALELQANNQSFTPEHYVVAKEMHEHFEKTLRNLPYKLKEVFLLRHEAGLSFKEISKLLHCPVNRLLGRMHLAVKAIRAEMREFINEA
jgi:RNA polymerase sigma-70 factor (ECF subfamily)